MTTKLKGGENSLLIGLAKREGKVTGIVLRLMRDGLGAQIHLTVDEARAARDGLASTITELEASAAAQKWHDDLKAKGRV